MADDFNPKHTRCPNCGDSFWQDAAWKSICLPCWIERKQAEKRSGHSQQREQRKSRRRRDQPDHSQPAPPIDADMLRLLIQLAHPDKHGGSAGATRATQYLLELKAKTR